MEIGVQNLYPLCRNSQKSTPKRRKSQKSTPKRRNSQKSTPKRRRRPMAKNWPFFDVFINADA